MCPPTECRVSFAQLLFYLALLFKILDILLQFLNPGVRFTLISLKSGAHLLVLIVNALA